jgi:hypothetical protein
VPQEQRIGWFEETLRSVSGETEAKITAERESKLLPN